jgi:hypothetical protein
MQKLINEYFNKLCSEKFFKNDEEEIVGKAKDVIENLKQQYDYANNPENALDDEDIEFITNEVTELIEQINNTYTNKDDIIKIAFHPMAGFYVLRDKETLFEELKEYYEELEEK